MSRGPLIQRYVVFTSKLVGRKSRRRVDVSYMYLSEPVRGSNPIFEARVGKDYVKAFLSGIAAPYNLIGEDILVLEGEDPDTYLRRLVVYSGVRQHINNSVDLAGTVQGLNEVEVLFWYSRFLEAYEEVGYWGVYRVAKAFRLLYRVW
ncbi:MAG: hypothetical protein QXZ63_02525 [Sulfolobales archaeon]